MYYSFILTALDILTLHQGVGLGRSILISGLQHQGLLKPQEEVS